ncbi:hypothetical protein OESDEN_00975 [Oesophagostomum dentatum]|uniref:Uncharacterized protein n=1 Tax=Oesophagostomum dentatum TaxID=61180 RepID=A0A0B1TUD0_OESDE|nr:hypothetical protein OESDEN_00975 [Oesophagostomum dentatum]
MADGDGDADTVPIQSSSERQMASDCNATLNGNSDNSSETQEDIGTSQSMQSIGGKFPPSVVREFEHIYDDDGGGIFIHSSK